MRVRRWTLIGVLSTAALLSACAGNGPYNSTADGADGKLMLKGHDPIAYFTLGKQALGSAGRDFHDVAQAGRDIGLAIVIAPPSDHSAIGFQGKVEHAPDGDSNYVAQPSRYVG